MITYHGVDADVFHALRDRVEGYGFPPSTEDRGVLAGDGVDIAFSFDSSAHTLEVEVRRTPLLVSRGHLYGLIADALITLGAKPVDPLS